MKNEPTLCYTNLCTNLDKSNFKLRETQASASPCQPLCPQNVNLSATTLTFHSLVGLACCEIDIPAAKAASEFVQRSASREVRALPVGRQNPSHTSQTLRHNNTPGVCFIFEKNHFGIAF